jgi:hypothetical protein
MSQEFAIYPAQWSQPKLLQFSAWMFYQRMKEELRACKFSFSEFIFLIQL